MQDTNERGYGISLGACSLGTGHTIALIPRAYIALVKLDRVFCDGL